MQAYDNANGRRMAEIFNGQTFEDVRARMDERKAQIEQEGGTVAYRVQLTKNQAKRLRKKER